MGAQTIDALLLKRMFLAGAKNLEKNKEYINELNVFPVPDGDTGTNMTMTIMSAARELSNLSDDAQMDAVCKAISGGSLRGARGNSGVILSQLLRGFTKQVKTETEISLPLIADAFEKAVDTAYKAVMKPKEGTILTVARGVSEKGRELVENGEEDLEVFIAEVIKHAQVVLDSTPDMLPVLKEAGVVDSGGCGLLAVLQGAFDLYLGKEIDLTISSEDKEGAEPEEKKSAKEDLKYLYVVDFTILLEKNFNIKSEMDLKEFLESIGEKVSVKVDSTTVSVHVVTNDPGMVIQKALLYGQLDNISVTNRNGGKTPAAEPVKEEPKAPKKDVGFIAVSIGDGVNEIFKSLGVDYIIEGGQTMNPSTEDILNAVDKVNADTIFVLPNNKNIVLAANQAADLSTDKTLRVIPTKTIPQGITAVINYVPDLSVDENEANMITEIGNVKTGQVTYSVRDTNIDGKEIKKDDYMGIGDKGLISVGTDIKEVTLSMVAGLVDEDSELISIYYGSDVTEADAEAIRAEIASANSSCDVELQYGGQPIYYYVVSVE